MNRRPSFQIYPGDELRKPISGCSLAAQGLWLRMRMLMHDSDRYGYLSMNGSPMQAGPIAQRCGCSLPEYETLLAELDRAGVTRRSITAKSETIYCPDLVRAERERLREVEKKRRQREKTCPENVPGISGDNLGKQKTNKERRLIEEESVIIEENQEDGSIVPNHVPDMSTTESPKCPQNVPKMSPPSSSSYSSSNNEDFKKKNIKRKKQTSPPPLVKEFLTEEKKIWAQTENFSGDLKTVTEACFDHFRAKGENRADWDATWRNWIRNNVEWAKEKKEKEAKNAKSFKSNQSTATKSASADADRTAGLRGFLAKAQAGSRNIRPGPEDIIAEASGVESSGEAGRGGEAGATQFLASQRFNPRAVHAGGAEILQIPQGSFSEHELSSLHPGIWASG